MAGMSVVIDTNVIVSAIISPSSKPGLILEMTLNGELSPHYSTAIMDEYEDVLFRPKFGFKHRSVIHLLDRIVDVGTLVNPKPSTIILPDESDRVFYDAAKSVDAYLVTGNLKHYPPEDFVVKPVDFILLVSGGDL